MYRVRKTENLDSSFGDNMIVWQVDVGSDHFTERLNQKYVQQRPITINVTGQLKTKLINLYFIENHDSWFIVVCIYYLRLLF